MIGRRLGTKWEAGLQLFEGFETINNPGLQYNVTTTIPGWSIALTRKNGAFITADTTWIREGLQSLELREAWGSSFTQAEYIRVYRAIDVTDINKIVMDLKTGLMTTAVGSNASVYFDGVKVLTINTPDVEMLNYEIDCSLATGNKVLQFEVYVAATATSRYSQLLIDNIRTG